METPLIYPPRADERIMQRKQVIEMAVQGKISWIQAAEILKVTTRQMRRMIGCITRQMWWTVDRIMRITFAMIRIIMTWSALSEAGRRHQKSGERH